MSVSNMRESRPHRRRGVGGFWRKATLVDCNSVFFFWDRGDKWSGGGSRQGQQPGPDQSLTVPPPPPAENKTKT